VTCQRAPRNVTGANDAHANRDNCADSLTWPPAEKAIGATGTIGTGNEVKTRRRIDVAVSGCGAETEAPASLSGPLLRLVRAGTKNRFGSGATLPARPMVAPLQPARSPAPEIFPVPPTIAWACKLTEVGDAIDTGFLISRPHTGVVAECLARGPTGRWPLDVWRGCHVSS
jgi:hypothetical protein